MRVKSLFLAVFVSFFLVPMVQAQNEDYQGLFESGHIYGAIFYMKGRGGLLNLVSDDRHSVAYHNLAKSMIKSAHWTEGLPLQPDSAQYPGQQFPFCKVDTLTGNYIVRVSCSLPSNGGFIEHHKSGHIWDAKTGKNDYELIVRLVDEMTKAVQRSLAAQVTK